LTPLLLTCPFVAAFAFHLLIIFSVLVVGSERLSVAETLGMEWGARLAKALALTPVNVDFIVYVSAFPLDREELNIM
jgi:hypothetical protein